MNRFHADTLGRQSVFIRHFLQASLVLFFAGAASAQPTRPVVPGRPPIRETAVGVTAYEQKDFGGRSAIIAAGEHAFTDWRPSSIKVPPGYVAILYGSADAGGGYGASVDLLEDRADLSPFGLNQAAFIAVFTARPGFFWARNSMQSGEFVAGHWERNRAAGNPVNEVAVASPPLPAHVSTVPTAVQQQGTKWTITALGIQSQGDAAQWEHAESLMGVIGSDLRGPQEIGSAAIERASNNKLIPDWINFWYPVKQPNDHRSVVYFKRTLTGVVADTIEKRWTGITLPADPLSGGRPIAFTTTYTISDAPHIADLSGTYPDHDLNVDVIPFADYMYLINDSHRPEKSTEVKAKDLVDSDGDPCTDPFIKVECEIDSSDVAKQLLVNALKSRIGKQVAVYGPWIYDIGHCDHPEIHPAEQIWWSDTNFSGQRQYHLNLFCDSSGRFWWRSQMDDGTMLKPWGAPPITGLFAIAFEVGGDLVRAGFTGKQFEVRSDDFYNVAIPDPDGDKPSNLVYQNNTLVSFVPHTAGFKVSFEGVGLKPGSTNIVRGLLVIETTVGSVKDIGQPGLDPDKTDGLGFLTFQKVAGHSMFTVTEKDIDNSPVVR